jgi:hypothetical protein
MKWSGIDRQKGATPMTSLKQTVRSLITAKKSIVTLEGRLLQTLARMAASGRAQAAKPRSTRRRVLQCPRCSRKFALPLHLGRHLSVTHKRKSQRAAKSRR